MTFGEISPMALIASLSSWKSRARLGGDETGLWSWSLRGSLSVIRHQPPSHRAGILDTA